MGLVNGAIQIGRSALLAYQSALQVVGNNVTNAGSASYTRQSPLLNPYQGVILPEGFMPGGGVMLDGLQRHVDETLENRLRVAMGDQSDALAQQQTLGRIEAVLNELSDHDLSTLIQEFFNSFYECQNNPHDDGVRGMVLTAGASLVNEIQRQRVDVLSLRDELNVQLADEVERADELATDIAALNVRITAMESSGTGGANALRDQRDAMLRELGEIVEIQVREQPNGGVNVYIGNELLISGGMSRGLTSTLETVNNEPRTVVRFADNNREVNLVGGHMAGIVAARDTHVLGHVDSLNNLSLALINEVNKVHAEGQGLKGYSQLTGAFDVLDATVALNSSDSGLNLTPINGSFIIYLTNTEATPPTRVATTIDVDLDGIGVDETLTSLAAKIDAVDKVTATVTIDNRLQLTAADGYTITFGEDSSDVLAALGMNVFFTGTNSEDLAVNQDLISDPELLAAATQHADGDGSNAGAIAALATTSLSGLGNQSVTEFYNAIASNVAVQGAAATNGVESADSIVLSLSAQRESLSGVSLDEETIEMLRFERAFQAAARYTSVVNDLVGEMLTIV